MTIKEKNICVGSTGGQEASSDGFYTPAGHAHVGISGEAPYLYINKQLLT